MATQDSVITIITTSEGAKNQRRIQIRTIENPSIPATCKPQAAMPPLAQASSPITVDNETLANNNNLITNLPQAKA
jgi:hypothetical protein